jgi:hypothetical protein
MPVDEKTSNIIRLAELENGSGLPLITLVAGQLHEIATQGEAALIAAGVPFYSRGGHIVRPIMEEVAAFKGRRTKIIRLKQVTRDVMRDHLSRVARWERFDLRTHKAVPANPPYDVADVILGRDGEWKLRSLTGVITTPTLRPDGSILSEAGFDEATGLLLIAPPPMPDIPIRPSRDDALAALALLEDLLVEFPFVSDADRSVALSALMTPVARGAMQVVPLHAVTAPEAGTGKSFLIDTASAISVGEIAPAITAGRTEEETEKRLFALLVTGQPIISIDNLNGALSGDFICQAIERPLVESRILGATETKRIRNTVTLYGNGNNLRLLGDIVRRVILCSMDANLERPELRSFRSDPVATVLANRGRYVAAVLTIVGAYAAADYPQPCAPLASFEDWSKFIRSSLVWLGRTDPVSTMDAARRDDPVLGDLRAFVAAWQAAVGMDKPLTSGGLKKASDTDENFGKAVSAVASTKDGVSAKRLGHWLGRNKGRVVDGIKIVGEQDTHTKQLKWRLADPAGLAI